MKRLKLLGAIACLALFASSCTVGHTITVTNNPVGTKYAKGKTVEEAVQKGNIKTIGSVEIVTKMYFIIPGRRVYVQGE